MVSRNTLVMIAKLYYAGNLSQQEIADMMGFSRLKVSRLLKECREKHIVEFTFNTSPMLREDMAAAIKNQYRFKDVIVVTSESTREKSKSAVGKAAAGYFAQKIQDNMSVGIAWGTTSSQFVQHFNAQKERSGCRVIQITGGMYIPGINIDGRDIVRALAGKLNASWHLLQTPMVVQNVMTRQLLMEEPEIQRHFMLFPEIDIAVVGLGSAVPEKSVTYMGGYITLEESRALVAGGAMADICGRRILADGSATDCSLNSRVLSIDLPTLAGIPLVIGVGEGADKAPTIIAGAQAGVIKSLVIDELAAIAVLNATAHGPNPRRTAPGESPKP